MENFPIRCRKISPTNSSQSGFITRQANPSKLRFRDFDPEEVCRTLTRKGETLKHLCKKYYAVGEVNGKRPLSYRQYHRRYQNWLGSKNVTIHIPRTPDVNLELDYAGKTLWFRDRHNPEKKTKVTIFIAALSYSDYFYIENMTYCDKIV